MARQNLKLLSGNGIRTTGLHGILQTAGQRNMPVNGRQQPFQLLGRQGSRRAASYVECTSLEAGTCQHPADCLNFPEQRLKIGLQQRPPTGKQKR